MNHEAVKTFLEALKTDPRAIGLLEKTPEPESGEARIRAYVKIAEELGCNVSEADLKEYIADRNQVLKARAETAAEEIRELPEEDLGEAAGGGTGKRSGEHATCKYSYKNRENCWSKDGCDHIYHHYAKYQCHYYQRCDNLHDSLCDTEQGEKCFQGWY